MPAETHERTANSWRIELPRTRIRTLEELLETCEVDAQVWEVERFVCNKWEVGAKDAEGRIQVEPLFQVKAWLKKRAAIAAVRDEIRAILEEAKAEIPPPRAEIVHLPRPGGHLLELSIPDAHLGKLSWPEEAGEDYTLNIARDLYERAVAELVRRTSGYDLGRILLVVGNDLLHADNKSATTTRGTRQDVDSRQPKVFRAARQMIQGAVEELRAIAPVDVLIVPGNHDEETMFYLGDALEVAFARTDGVRVDNQAALRKFYEYGNVGLMFTHGDKESHRKLANLMATEQPLLWGRTRFREIHMGHLHKRREETWVGVNEELGVVARILPSLCAADAWHSANGYIGNTRSAEAYVWHPEDGLQAIHQYAPRLERRLDQHLRAA